MSNKLLSPNGGTEDGMFFLRVATDGTTGPEWISRLENKGIPVTGYAKHLLRSEDFIPTTGRTIKVAILQLEEKRLYAPEEVRSLAEQAGLLVPTPEIACLIRENISNEEMRLDDLIQINVLHDFIPDWNSVPSSLLLWRQDPFRYGLHGSCYYPGDTWIVGGDPSQGFAFIAA